MASHQPDREDMAPFLLRVFYRHGAFHRPDEFAARALPPSLDLYTWPSCTLDELAHQLAAERPALLPDPAVGTRLAFRLIFPDARSMDNASHTAPRFMVKDLGSVVIGDGRPGLDVAAADDATDVADRVSPVRQPGGIKDGLRTLEGSKFVVGDYVSCAILPPLPDGAVAPEPTRHIRAGPSGGPPTHHGRRDLGAGRGRDWGAGGLPHGVPHGEWRRGEALPDGPDRGAWGRGRNAGRGGR
ncbi:Histone deacetylase complex subunit SAP18 like protein [Verticillium longisporum]|nr:Histone deacetylase complex subunit SAP18 like protein [Verticillium longisporum]